MANRRVIESAAHVAESPDRMSAGVWRRVRSLVNEAFRHLHRQASIRELDRTCPILKGPYHFYITLDEEDGLVISFCSRDEDEPQRIYAQDIRKHSVRMMGPSDVGDDPGAQYQMMFNAKFMRFYPWEIEERKGFSKYAEVRALEFLSMLAHNGYLRSPGDSKGKTDRVFLCHASEDKEAVIDVYGRLKDAGINPWLDKEDLLPGQPWEQEISRVIRSSACVVVFLSRASVSKQGYLQKEFKLALDVLDEMPEGRLFLIPVKLQDCQVPGKFRELHWCDLYEASGFEKLVASIRRASALRSSR